MKQAYKEINLRSDTLDMIAFINKLIGSYMAQGFTLSVRQLYYQLVARDMLPNTERSYKRVANIINDGRIAGLIDWDAIEDRNRDIELRQRWVSGQSIVQAAADSYHMDMWDSQDTRVFVIVEKAALAGILGGVCAKYDVPLLAARGYPSVSIVREMALEHMEHPIDCGQDIVVIHMGDHDPSGIDMTRDLRERFEMFLGDFGGNFTLKRIALSMDQVDELKPPPNPAKATDSRFKGYRKMYGSQSWELDALDPSHLVELLTEQITDYIDQYRWDERSLEVEGVRKRLNASAKRFARAA